MQPIRAIALAALFLTACGEDEVRVSHRTPLALADAGALPGTSAPKSADGTAAPAGDKVVVRQPGGATEAGSDASVGGGGSPGDEPAPGVTTTMPPATTMPRVPPPESFGSGLYFAKIDASGKLALQHDNEPVAGMPLLPKEGFSIAETAVVTFEAGATVYDNHLVVASPDGKMRRVINLPNIYAPQHPTLSPDGTAVAFDAHAVSGGKVIAQTSQVYVTDLDAQTTEIVSQGGDAVAPVWFPVTRRILYLGNSSSGRSLEIVDPNDPQVFTVTSMAGDSMHAAISADEGEIFVPSTGATYTARLTPRTNIGAAIAKSAAAAGMAGFAPLAAVYRPAGGSIVLAGTVKGQVVIAEVDRAGNAFKLVSGPFPMTAQTAAGGKYLPVYFADFP